METDMVRMVKTLCTETKLNENRDSEPLTFFTQASLSTIVVTI